MQYTLTITGNSEGYSLTVGRSSLSAYGRIAKRMDGTTGITRDGTFTPPRAHASEVDAACEAVMADGITRTITIGEPDPVQPRSKPEWRSRRGLTLTEEMDRDDTEF